jgi:hypothetical protein
MPRIGGHSVHRVGLCWQWIELTSPFWSFVSGCKIPFPGNRD